MSDVNVSTSTHRFADRHIGPRPAEIAQMLATLGFTSVDELMKAAVPQDIAARPAGTEVAAMTESEAQRELRRLEQQNSVLVQMIGLGYSDTITPPVIRRNVVESPGWYTSYTPYQPEISQGRLEALLNFQTVVSELTALPISNASLLDEATAVAEAVLLMRRGIRGRADGVVILDEQCHPQTIAVTSARAQVVGIKVVVADLDDGLPSGVDPASLVGCVAQQPGTNGAVRDLTPLVAEVHEAGAMVAVAADLLSLALMVPPGEQGADIAVGSAQRFGVPLFYGGPHAGYLAVRSGLERQIPGRMVGVSKDANGGTAFRLALQTREQHIRREKATSNICTAQALLAVVASMYAVWHGPEGLREIAEQVNSRSCDLAEGLHQRGVEIVHTQFFDTVLAEVPGQSDALVAAALRRGINIRTVSPDRVVMACSEVTTAAHIAALLDGFDEVLNDAGIEIAASSSTKRFGLCEELLRTSEYLDHPVFHRYRSETAMMRYLRDLSDRDLALDRTMIPLGSCTMKLNATAEMEPITWPGFANIHPYAPRDQALGYASLIATLETRLAELTGYAAVSVQPNSGAMGEYAGLMAIRGYHASRNDSARDICLIPASAHGTNAASAVLAGLNVVVVATAEDGSIDLESLAQELENHGSKVAAIMITYPSTHGVYEETVREVCEAVHGVGGQVYIDGANFNALTEYARPGEFGGDVSHLNLHKTFAIPHGGGGPGVGPIGVREHLVPFLPGSPLPGFCLGDAGHDGPSGLGTAPPVAGAPFGSAGVLPITWTYLAMMGTEGLRRATEIAVLNANYVARRLNEVFPVLYTGSSGLVAHECIFDLREITKSTGVSAEDVAKRLVDYGFHAPTMSFPVAGTLMVEPTESEDLAELDRFCEAMLAIGAEITNIAEQRCSLEDSPLRHAPHTAQAVTATDWGHSYSRTEAAFPPGVEPSSKYWPPVARIDNAFGDRNLHCVCPPIEEYRS